MPKKTKSDPVVHMGKQVGIIKGECRGYSGTITGYEDGEYRVLLRELLPAQYIVYLPASYLRQVIKVEVIKLKPLS